MAEAGLPEGFDIRYARPEDNDDLVEVSRAAALRLGEASVVVDPGDDYFLPFRLMDQWTALVVTHNDRAVGVQCGSQGPGSYDGAPARVSQMIHTRFHPDYARMGLWSHLNRRMLDSGQQLAKSFDQEQAKAAAPLKRVGVAYVSVENERMRRMYGAGSVWAGRPFRVTIPCATTTGDRGARQASAADAESIAAILNESHEGEELFLPYTTESLTSRLERAPDLYSWQNFLIDDGAALGVWHSPEVRIRTEGDVTTRSRRALVLDAGFVPGAEGEFEALVRSACAQAADEGYDHLSIFTTDPSPLAKVLEPLADRVEPYDVVVPFVPEPAGTAERGVYVDQAYF